MLPWFQQLRLSHKNTERIECIRKELPRFPINKSPNLLEVHLLSKTVTNVPVTSHFSHIIKLSSPDSFSTSLKLAQLSPISKNETKQKSLSPYPRLPTYPVFDLHWQISLNFILHSLLHLDISYPLFTPFYWNQ